MEATAQNEKTEVEMKNLIANIIRQEKKSNQCKINKLKTKNRRVISISVSDEDENYKQLRQRLEKNINKQKFEDIFKISEDKLLTSRLYFRMRKCKKNKV